MFGSAAAAMGCWPFVAPAVRRATPGDMPVKRLKARLKAASDP
jgi:hypothetical protein